MSTKTRFGLVCWLALTVGCIDHAADRAKVAGDAACHQLELEACYQAAVESHAVGDSPEKITADYKVCLDEAAKKCRR